MTLLQKERLNATASCVRGFYWVFLYGCALNIRAEYIGEKISFSWMRPTASDSGLRTTLA